MSTQGPRDDEYGLLREVLDALPGGVVRVSRLGEIVTGNAEALSLLGFSLDALTRRVVQDFETETIREDGSPFPAAEYPVALALATGRPAGPATLGVRRSDGTLRWAVFRAMPVFGSDGTLEGAVATFLDITERKAAEAALLASELRWTSLVQAVPDFVVVADADLNIKSINRTLPQFDVPATVGTVTLSYIDPADHPAWLAAFNRALRDHETSTFEARAVGPTGTMAWYESIFVPVVGDGGDPQVMIVARDVTERREMLARLAEKERLASVGMVASSVAHEVMNPLTYVLGNLDALRNPKLDDPERRSEALERVHEGAMRMRQIVWDLRSLGRTGSEDLFYVDVRSVLDTAIRLAGLSAERRAVIELDLEDVPGVVANEARLCQVFMNVLLNAVQSMEDRPPASRSVRVSALRDDGEGLVGVVVDDEGHGIAEADRGRVFDAFFTTKQAGTGLGLSISKDLVTRMGGRITIEGRAPRGTRFVVWLPAGKGAGSRNAAEPAR